MSTHHKMKVGTMRVATPPKVKEKTDLHEEEPLLDVQEDSEEDPGGHLHKVQATKATENATIAIRNVTIVANVANVTMTTDTNSIAIKDHVTAMGNHGGGAEVVTDVTAEVGEAAKIETITVKTRVLTK